MSIPIVVLGAGLHAGVVIDILENLDGFVIHGCTSPDPAARPPFGYPLLGSDAILPDLHKSGVTHAFIGIGDNRARHRAMRTVTDLGFTLVNAISRHAIISPRARIGRGVAIMHGAILVPNSEVGDGAIVNTAATLDHDCRLGECAHISSGVNLGGHTSVGTGALLGIGCCTLPDISVGDWAVVGAGAAVIRDVPPGATVFGVPARRMPMLPHDRKS